MTIQGLVCKFISRKGRKAEVEIEGQTILVSLDFLPRSAEAGSTFRLYFLNEGDAALEEKKLAKIILEEILNGK